jgi:predicted RNase H-like HicB family nuclease
MVLLGLICMLTAHYAGHRYTEAMTFRVVLEYDAEAKAFSAISPELPGCASAGETEEEARRNIKEAIELYLKPSDIELAASAKIAEVRVG